MRPRRQGRITKYGTIRGGVCDRAHQARRQREKGALEMVDLLFRQKKCLERKEDKVRVVAWPEYDSLDYGRLWGGDYEIGLLRFSQQVIPLLIEQKRWVSQKFLEKLARQIASYEFGVSSSEPNNPLAILEGKVKFGLAPPHKDHIYRQKIKDGDL